MESGVTIIGVIILLACIIPLVIAHNNNKKKEKKLLGYLLSYAQAASLKISQHDLWLNTAIAIDNDTNVLLFIRNVDGNENVQQVNLYNAEHCHIQGADGTPDTIKRLALVFTSPNEQDAVLEFYNENSSLQINDELQLIKKWEGIAKSRLSQK